MSEDDDASAPLVDLQLSPYGRQPFELVATRSATAGEVLCQETGIPEGGLGTLPLDMTRLLCATRCLELQRPPALQQLLLEIPSLWGRRYLFPFLSWADHDCAAAAALLPVVGRDTSVTGVLVALRPIHAGERISLQRGLYRAGERGGGVLQRRSTRWRELPARACNCAVCTTGRGVLPVEEWSQEILSVWKGHGVRAVGALPPYRALWRCLQQSARDLPHGWRRLCLRRCAVHLPPPLSRSLLMSADKPLLLPESRC